MIYISNLLHFYEIKIGSPRKENDASFVRSFDDEIIRERERGKWIYERERFSFPILFITSARNPRRSRDSRPWFGEIKRGREETERSRRGPWWKQRCDGDAVRKLSEILYYYDRASVKKKIASRVVGLRFISSSVIVVYRYFFSTFQRDDLREISLLFHHDWRATRYMHFKCIGNYAYINIESVTLYTALL